MEDMAARGLPESGRKGQVFSVPTGAFLELWWESFEDQEGLSWFKRSIVHLPVRPWCGLCSSASLHILWPKLTVSPLCLNVSLSLVYDTNRTSPSLHKWARGRSLFPPTPQIPNSHAFICVSASERKHTSHTQTCKQLATPINIPNIHCTPPLWQPLRITTNFIAQIEIHKRRICLQFTVYRAVQVLILKNINHLSGIIQSVLDSMGLYCKYFSLLHSFFGGISFNYFNKKLNSHGCSACYCLLFFVRCFLSSAAAIPEITPCEIYLSSLRAPIISPLERLCICWWEMFPHLFGPNKRELITLKKFPFRCTWSRQRKKKN